MWFLNNYCRSKTRLTGKTVVITGANCGIGKEAAKDFYRRGARVILACRNVSKAEQAMDDIKQSTPRASNELVEEPGELAICQLDLTSISSVKDCAQRLLSTEPYIHILINNAGVFWHPLEITQDGFETHFQVNYLGHFLLTYLLLPKMKQSAPGCRIINVSSLAHKYGDIYFEDLNLEHSYSPFKAYCQSKLANVLFTNELACRFKEAKIDGINVYSLHPGVVKTDIGRYIGANILWGVRVFFQVFGPFMKTAEQGAQTTIHCAVDENAGTETGLYYDNCRVTRASRKVYDSEYSARLWKHSCEILDLSPEI